jgi:hypothetical protein
VPAKFDHRTFVRLDQGYDEHPKVMPLSDSAFRAHVESMCWASRNEGKWRIPKPLASKKWRPKVLRELVEARLFDDAGYIRLVGAENAAREESKGHLIRTWKRTRKAIPAHVCEVSAA